MSRVVRQSKYRHVFGTPAKREKCYDNLKITRNAWDSNFVCGNSKYFGICWNSEGGGAFAVIPWEQKGKLPSDYPLITGHSGSVLDIDFNPFNDSLIASASEDAYIKIWGIPEGGLKETMTEPLQSLSGHRRKVGQVLFNPCANNVLASSGADFAVKVWDIEAGESHCNIDGQHADLIQSIDWSWDGRLIVSSSKDKKIRIMDPRAGTVAHTVDGHPGVKGSRIKWLGEKNIIFSVGFSRTSERQFWITDPRNPAEPILSQSIDTSSGILMPFYDNDTGVLFLAGKGDGNIRYYEFNESGDQIFFLSEYKSSVPQRGIAMMPKYTNKVNKCEIVKLLKLAGNVMEPISFRVPRKSELFQDDIFPLTRGTTPGTSSSEWFSGRDGEPAKISLEGGFKAPSAPKEEFKPVVKVDEGPKSETELREEYEKQKSRIAYLESELVKRDHKIRDLEAQLKELGK